MSTHFDLLVHPECHLRALLLHQQQHQSFYGDLDTSFFSVPQLSNIYSFYAICYFASKSLMKYTKKLFPFHFIINQLFLKDLFQQFYFNQTMPFKEKINHQRVFCISTQPTYVQSEKKQSFIIQKSLCKCIYLELLMCGNNIVMCLWKTCIINTV